jgi:hypothetical protein
MIESGVRIGLVFVVARIEFVRLECEMKERTERSKHKDGCDEKDGTVSRFHVALLMPIPWTMSSKTRH